MVARSSMKVRCVSGIFIKTLGIMGSEKHHEMVHGDTRILIQLMYLESRHVSNVTRVGDLPTKIRDLDVFFRNRDCLPGGFQPGDSNRFHH